MGLEVCRRLSVPACLLFNESPQFESVLEAVDLGFNLVMFSDEKLTPEETVAREGRFVPRPIRQARPSKRKWPCCPAWAGR